MQPEPIVVGIAGPSGSGKTTLARLIVERLPGGAVLFPLDAYYRDQAGVAEDALNVDDPAAFEHHLIIDHLNQLRAGVAVQQPIYDYATHTRAPVRRTVNPLPNLVVEGISALYWPEVRNFFTTSVFLTLDHTLCLERRIERDQAQRSRSRTAVVYHYERSVRPMYDKHIHPTRDHATLVLDARAPADLLAARIMRSIEAPGL